MSRVVIFAYGTLMPGCINHHICAAMVMRAQPALTLGELYALPLGYPALTCGDRSIQGYWMELTTPALEVLDQFEQHDPLTFQQHYPDLKREDHQYDRQLIDVFDYEQAALGKAWAYCMTLAQINRLNGIRLLCDRWSSAQQEEALRSIKSNRANI